MDTVEKVPKILNYSIASIKLHSDAIISFPNKLKINHITIFTNLLILQQKIINTYCPPDMLIFLKSALNVEIFCSFGIRSDVTNI